MSRISDFGIIHTHEVMKFLSRIIMKIGQMITYLVLIKDRGILDLLLEYLTILALWILCQGYHVGAQLFFSTMAVGLGCTSSCTSGPTSGLLPSTLLVLLLVTLPVLLPVTLPVLLLVTLSVLLLVALPELLPVAIPGNPVLLPVAIPVLLLVAHPVLLLVTPNYVLL